MYLGQTRKMDLLPDSLFTAPQMLGWPTGLTAVHNCIFAVFCSITLAGLLVDFLI